MLYNGKVIGVICISIILALTACSRNTEDSNSQSSEVKELSASLVLDENSNEVSNEYLASKDDGSLNFFDDYDTSITLCNNAFDEFIRAVKHDDNADFSKFIENSTLREYMQYRIDNHIYGYDCSNHRFFIMEVDFSDDYALIKGVLSTSSGNHSSSAEGITYFLIKNINGKLSIVDWYWDAKDSPDITFRGEFSIENNLTYWEEPEKYAEVLRKIRR